MVYSNALFVGLQYPDEPTSLKENCEIRLDHTSISRTVDMLKQKLPVKIDWIPNFCFKSCCRYDITLNPAGDDPISFISL